MGRPTELERMLALAVGGQSVRLAAPRRYGKTTLLAELAEVAWSAHGLVPAVVDLSRVTSVDDVVIRITRAYAAGLERGRLRAAWRAIRARLSAQAQIGLPGARVGAAIGQPAPADRLAALHEVLDLPVKVHERTGERCLVVFDEFQDLLTVDQHLDGVLRSHLQHHGAAASYLFAGSQPSLMATLFGDRERPLFEQARAMTLGPLPLADLTDYVIAKVEEAGRDDLADDAAEIVALSEGHPQRAMLLAHMLFEQPTEAEDPVGGALSAALREASDALEQAWRGLSTAQRRVLGGVAAGHTSVLSNAALEYASQGKSTQAKARDALITATHLRMQGDRAEFVDPLMAHWLRAR
ncbi:MAG TPA: hypothetical protein VFZ89_16785 [Solirubrobacteraceae bacterium]